MIALEVFKKILEENGDKFPLLTLDEFFDGNSEEDSIAPNGHLSADTRKNGDVGMF